MILFIFVKNFKNDMIGKTLQSKHYCSEPLNMIENYDIAVNDNKNFYELHHRLEIQGNKFLSHKDLIEQNLYYNRPASELIFLTRSEHRKLHMKNPNTIEKFKTIGKTRHISEKTKQKISQSHKGKKLTDEHKKMLSLHSARFCPTKGMHRVYNNPEHTKWHFE